MLDPPQCSTVIVWSLGNSGFISVYFLQTAAGCCGNQNWWEVDFEAESLLSLFCALSLFLSRLPFVSFSLQYISHFLSLPPTFPSSCHLASENPHKNNTKSSGKTSRRRENKNKHRMTGVRKKKEREREKHQQERGRWEISERFPGVFTVTDGR